MHTIMKLLYAVPGYTCTMYILTTAFAVASEADSVV